MLGSLARKLRAAWFDTIYYRLGDDRGILKICSDEKRVLVTADRQLVATAVARGLTALLVRGEDDRGRATSIAAAARAVHFHLIKGPPRCSLCNSVLATIRMTETKGMVPASVAKKHRNFLRCTGCAQVYWKGSHWKELRSIGCRLDGT